MGFFVSTSRIFSRSLIIKEELIRPFEMKIVDSIRSFEFGFFFPHAVVQGIGYIRVLGEGGV